MGQYIQLTEKERVKIFKGLKEGKSRGKIAKEIGRDASTIGREIKRNSSSDLSGEYLPDTAQKKSQERRYKQKPKLSKDEALKAKIIDCLKRGWSPEIISGRLRLEDGECVCPETIYDFIYSIEGQAQKLYIYLIKKRKVRGVRHGRKHRKQKIPNRTSIHDRPDEVNSRISFGHLEIDLLFVSGDQSKNVGVIIERKSRLMLMFMNNSKKSCVVINNCAELLKTLPLNMRQSVTFDNGLEFANHEELQQKLGIQTYFCDPYSPWQKGQVECANSLIRRMIPRNLSLHSFTKSLIEKTMNTLNSLPRKCLGFKTPLEVYNAYLTTCCTSC
jgi:transposase, IS30 family